MILPTTPQEPNISPEAFKWLIMGESGMGKSSFLAALYLWLLQHGYLPNLIIDPDNGCAALPGYIIQVRNWSDCKELLKLLQKEDATKLYSWISIDLLNVLYEFCYNHECKRMGVVYPSDLDGGKGHGKGWAIITKEFIGWLRDMGNLGLPLIGTCHVKTRSFKLKGREFDNITPAFQGKEPSSTYQKFKEAFDIIGYLTFDAETPEAIELIKELSPDAKLIGLAAHQTPALSTTRVIHFQPSQYWDAQDTSRQLPAKVILSKYWSEDWSAILEAWGKESGMNPTDLKLS